FADVLQRWPLDEFAVTRIIDTKARQDAHEATTPINQQVAEAILQGDLQFFLDRMPTDTEAQSDVYNRFNPLGMFRDLMTMYTDIALKGEACLVTDEQLYVLFRTMIPDSRYFQDSKTWRRRHYKSLGLEIDKKQRDPQDYKRQARGLKI